jgi:AcrR family transcriptional regulator
MTFASRAVERAVEHRRARAADEVEALVEAGMRVLRRRGMAGLTVAEVLAEAGLSTRAFYRHFRTKDELVLAVYEREAHRAHARLWERMGAAPSARLALEAWIDETLALGFDPRRARRTRVLAAEGARLSADHPAEFAAILDGVLEPLGRALAELGSPDPRRDARTVHAVTWELVAEKLGGGDLTLPVARAHVRRFCLPALGLAP